MAILPAGVRGGGFFAEPGAVLAADIADKEAYHLIDSARYATVWLTEMAGMTRQVIDTTHRVGAY